MPIEEFKQCLTQGGHMLKRLRLKIVGVVMLISFVVLVIAFTAMLVMQYANLYGQIDDALHNAIDRGPFGEITIRVGRFDTGTENRRYGFEDDLEGKDGLENNRNGEQTPLKTGQIPVAIFMVSSTGEIILDNRSQVTMEETAILTAIDGALSASEDEGYINDAGVYYLRSTSYDNNTVIAFADGLSLQQELITLAINMALVGGAILILLFFASIAFARYATRPVERAWEDQQRFVADASHELKTPLTVILANTDILSSDPNLDATEQQKWIQSTKTEAKHMKGLIDEMLMLAQSENTSAASQAQMKELNLSDITTQACLTFDAVAFEAGVMMNDDIEQNLAINGDNTQITRLVKILIDNAIKYAGVNGTVDVGLHKTSKIGRAHV